MGGAVSNTDMVALGVDLAVNVNKGLAPLGKGVHDRHANPVEAAGNLVALFVEFTAGVEPGHHEFQGADPFTGVYINGDTAAVIFHTDYVIPFQNYQYIVTVALHGLVYGVIYYLEYQMVQAVNSGGPNVHTGAFPYRLQTFKNLDIIGRIV
jgi:hypothetical protein